MAVRDHPTSASQHEINFTITNTIVYIYINLIYRLDQLA